MSYKIEGISAGVESVYVEIVTVERRCDGAVVRKHKHVKVLRPTQFSISEFIPDLTLSDKRVLVFMSGILEESRHEVLTDNTKLLPEEEGESHERF